MRPSFQFYPADWQGNANLRRCTHDEKGIWIDVMCLMHDSEEYGVLRWSLAEIAQAVGRKPACLRGLIAKGVLKGADAGGSCEPLTFAARHAGKSGVPVTLLDSQSGPIWYSSRMVRDEYVRTKRGETTRFGASPKVPPNPPPMGSPKGGFGDGSSSSSSSSSPKIESRHHNGANGHDPTAARQARGTRLPENWIPGPEGVAFCHETRPELDVQITFERFADYWRSQPGQKGVKLDWMATWRNWVRNESTNRGATR